MFLCCCSDTGLFGVYATCDAIGQYDLMYAITEALTSLCYNVDEDLLAVSSYFLKLFHLQLVHRTNLFVGCQKPPQSRYVATN